MLSAFPFTFRAIQLSSIYFNTETLPAEETFIVVNNANCVGGNLNSCGQTAYAEANQAADNIELISARISSGVLFAHNGDPPTPFATALAETNEELISP